MAIYTVKNDKNETFDVDEENLSQAEKDGYLPVVSNGAEEHRVAFKDIGKAMKDGYSPKLGTPIVGQGEAAALAALQGPSLGFADEAIAGAKSLFSDKPYKQIQAEEQALLDAAAEQNPLTYHGTELASGLLLNPGSKALGLGVKALSEGTGIAKTLSKVPAIEKALRLGTEGAVVGGAYGAGTAKQGEAAKEALKGAETGAKLGAGLSAIASSSGKALETVKKYSKAGKTAATAIDVLKNEGIDITNKAGANKAVSNKAKELAKEIQEASELTRQEAGKNVGKANKELSETISAAPEELATDLNPENLSHPLDVVNAANPVTSQGVDEASRLRRLLEDAGYVAKTGKGTPAALNESAILDYNKTNELRKQLRELANYKNNPDPDTVKQVQTLDKYLSSKIEQFREAQPELAKNLDKANEEFSQIATAQERLGIPGKYDKMSSQANTRKAVDEDSIAKLIRDYEKGSIPTESFREDISTLANRSPELLEQMKTSNNPAIQKAVDTLSGIDKRAKRISDIYEAIGPANSPGLTRTGLSTSSLAAKGAVTAYKAGQAGKKVFERTGVLTDEALRKTANTLRQSGNETIANVVDNMANQDLSGRRATMFVLQQNPAVRPLLSPLLNSEESNDEEK